MSLQEVRERGGEFTGIGIWMMSLQDERERIVSLQEEREKNDKLPGRKMIKITGRN
jgi:hypothetical protein